MEEKKGLFRYCNDLTHLIRFAAIAHGVVIVLVVFLCMLYKSLLKEEDTLAAGVFFYIVLFFSLFPVVIAGYYALYRFITVLRRIGESNPDFHKLSVYGSTVAMMLIVSHVFLWNGGTLTALFPIMICLLMILKGLYFRLVYKEMVQTASKKDSDDWVFLLVVHIILFVLTIITLGYFILMLMSGQGKSKESYESVCKLFGIAALAVYAIRFFFEYLFTVKMKKSLSRD